MPAYILTGAPGAGKTAVLRLLEISGYAVVEEAATDVIALGNALAGRNRGGTTISSTRSSRFSGGDRTSSGQPRAPLSSSTAHRCAPWR